MKTVETAEEWKACFKAREPVLIKDGLNNYFPKVAAWTPAYVKEKFGSLECKFADDGRPVRGKNVATYADFFDGPAESFYTFTRTPYKPGEATQSFMDDFHFPNTLFTREEVERHIFFGGPKDTGALPHEHGDALNCLASGHKRWVMFDARRGTYGWQRYQLKYYRDYSNGAQVADWWTKEYDELLADEKVRVHECTQQSGDIVYVPAGFSHTVFNDTAVLGIVLELHRG